MGNVSIQIFDLKESQAPVLYRNVWSQSIDASPFISPRILDILIGEGKQLDVAFFYYDTQIIGAFPYSITDGCLTLAGETMSDSIQLLFKPKIPLYQKYEAIRCLIQKLKPASILFKKLSDTNLDSLLLVKAFKELAYYHVYLESWSNPIIRQPNVPFDEAKFLKAFNKSNTRNYSNKFRREHKYTVDVIRANEGDKIKRWMEYFYMYHELRWSETNTPSIYSSRSSRKLLESKVKAWIDEGCGLLFSLNVEGIPVSMAICLIHGKTLLYHQIAQKRTKSMLKYPLNKIKLYELSKWMRNNGLENLDFGVGNEPYKYEYAPHESRIIRIYATKSKFNKTIYKGLTDFLYQRYPILNIFLNKWVRGLYSRIESSLHFLQNKMKTLFTYFSKSPRELVLKIVRKFRNDKYYFYRYRGSDSRIEPDLLTRIRIPSIYEVLEFYESQIQLSVKKRLHYLNKLQQGDVIPYAVFSENAEILSIAWKASPKESGIPDVETFGSPIVIIDCMTSKDHRGQGYYPALIAYVAAQNGEDSIIYTNDWHITSQKGIKKAGFEYCRARKIKNNGK